MRGLFIKVAFGLLVIMSATAGSSATIMVVSTSSDTVGQSIVYNLRNQISRSSVYKVAYTRDDAGFVISVVTVPGVEGRTAAYSAVLTMPPLDKKGYDYYVTSVVGYCGSEATERCASNILSGFDGDMMEIIGEFSKLLKKPK